MWAAEKTVLPWYNDGILTMDIIVNNKVDAMIGMDDITPYDFMG